MAKEEEEEINYIQRFSKTSDIVLTGVLHASELYGVFGI
jgi:hypothetical protein